MAGSHRAEEAPVGEKQVHLRHEAGMRFVATTGSGFEIAIDNARGNSAPRPTEVLLAALAGCTAMDVNLVLTKKRQPVSAYSVEVNGIQREGAPPDVFTEISVLHVVEGAVDPDALRRAIQLSATRYCTVSAQLASGVARISHRFLLRRPGADGGAAVEETGEVVVTGPARDLAADEPGPESAAPAQG